MAEIVTTRYAQEVRCRVCSYAMDSASGIEMVALRYIIEGGFSDV